jgi:hypothetical protein
MSSVVCHGKADGWGATAMMWVGAAILTLWINIWVGHFMVGHWANICCTLNAHKITWGEGGWLCSPQCLNSSNFFLLLSFFFNFHWKTCLVNINDWLQPINFLVHRSVPLEFFLTKNHFNMKSAQVWGRCVYLCMYLKLLKTDLVSW